MTSKASVGTRYVIITPVRDEEAYLPFTIDSVIAQTIRPVEWVIVDDGSTDSTGAVIDQCAKRHPWIVPVHRSNRGYRKSGGGVVEAFKEGYAALSCRDWEYIVKLDGDLSFGRDYFETCFVRFATEPRLGIGGGVIYNMMANGGSILDQGGPTFHVRGATKIYRKACWDDIGGLWAAPGWDTLDEVKANMKGWSTRSFMDILLMQHRVTGAADGSWHNLVKNGRANYISGYHPLFMAAKCVSRLRRRPYLLGSIALLYGFAASFLNETPMVDDSELVKYLRSQQLALLLGRETIWR